IRILNRSSAKADSLILELDAVAGATLEVVRESGWERAVAEAAIVINAASAGLNGEMPFGIMLDSLSSACVVCDLVYNPLETALLKQARCRGHRTIDGLGMLIHQAV